MLFQGCVNIITQSLFSRSKDEQILYLTIEIKGSMLTSSKIAQVF